MRRLRLLLSLVLSLAGSPVDAQFHHVYQPPPSGGSSYTGPIDAAGASAILCTSFARGCSSAYATGSNSAETITRTSDGHTCNLNVATNGGLSNTTGCSTGGDNGQSITSFLSGTTGTITTGVDQTGNGNTSTGSLAFTLACNGSIVCATLNGSTQQLTNASFAPTSAQPFTIAVVINANASGGNGYAISTFPLGVGATGTSAEALIYGGLTPYQPSMTTGAWHSIIVVYNGSSSTYSIDGATPTTAASLGTQALTSNFSIGAFSYAQFFTGSIEEVMIFGSALGGTAQTNLCHNFRVYFTTAGTC